MLSYKQIISKFQEFAENHFYLKSYGTGEAFQIVEHDKQKIRKYPMMWVEDQPFPFAPGSVTYSFRVYFLQQVPTLKNTDPETLEQINVVEAKSDMLQCAQDLMSFWVQDHNYPDLDVLKSTLGTPFHDTLMDSLTGFYIDIKLEQGFKYDSCSIPMTGIDPPPTPGCDDVLVTFNGVSVTSTPSGNTKTVIVQSDAAGNPQVGTITADTATELTIEVPAAGGSTVNSSNLFKTGAVPQKPGDDGNTQRGRGTDFFNLNFINPYGNMKCYTGIGGGYYDESTSQYKDVNGVVTTEALAFPNTLILNWKSYDPVGLNVLCMNYTRDQSGAPNTMMSNAPYTFGGFNDFYVANLEETESFFEAADAFTWLPLDFTLNLGGVIDRLHSSTSTSAVSNYTYINAFNRNSASGTGQGSVYYVRYLNTVTDLGL